MRKFPTRVEVRIAIRAKRKEIRKLQQEIEMAKTYLANFPEEEPHDKHGTKG